MRDFSPMSTFSVAISADNLAFCHLCNDTAPRYAACRRVADIEFLAANMVKIHDVGGIGFTTVSTWPGFLTGYEYGQSPPLRFLIAVTPLIVPSPI
jgi:hypothetical protein